MGFFVRLTVLCVAALPALAEAPTGWHPGAAELCLLPPYQSATTDAQRELRSLVADIEALAPGEDPLLGKLRSRGTAICVEDRPTVARGSYEVDSNLIALRASLGTGAKLLILIHELRHLDQYQRGFCPSTDYDMDEMARLTFMVEADAQAIATYYAWQLAKAGRPDAWEAVQAMPEYADVAASFARAVADGSSPEIAVAAAFDRWFVSPWRIETYRASACAAYLDRLDVTKRLRSYDPLPEGYFETLCRLPDGTPYRCDPPRPPD
ncbi:MAG: hypothetical protein B7Z02_10360 [Rhodobacterales bacterium 32-67-9]|nr:MAG: hypothetical protein B7Z02_10360 [Rhodobacterales bacterium 32-67-9]